MYCGNCGAKNEDGAKFCGACGKPLVTIAEASAPVPARKKKSVLSIVLVIIGILIVLGSGTVGAVALVKNLSDKKAEQAWQDEEDAAPVRESNVEETTPAGEPESVPSPLPAKEPEQAKEAEQKGKEVSLQAYLEEELIPSAGLLDIDKSYETSYSEVEDYGWVYPSVGYVQGISGIADYDIRDYDKDGADELLVLMLKPGEESCQTVWYQMYEQDPSGVRLAAEQEAALSVVGGADGQRLEFYVKETGSGVYLAERGYEAYYVASDGMRYEISILRYADEDFHDELDRYFYGSDFSDCEDEIRQIADELRKFGFTKSAEKLGERLEIDRTDGAEMLFLAEGRIIGDLSRYYETQSISDISPVIYRFYRDEEIYRARFHISDYRVERDDFGVSDGDRSIIAFFDRITFEGDNSDVIDRLNQLVQEMGASYAQDCREHLKEELENMGGFGGNEYYYMPLTAVSVYYDDDGNVSIGYSWEWYMGGVYNTGWECLNCNLDFYEDMYLPDVLGVDEWTARRMVAEALEADVTGDTEYWMEFLSNSYTFHFYYDAEHVTVCFNAYDLGLGGSGISVTLDRR